MSATAEAHQGSDIWKDLTQGYIPDDELDIHPSVQLHTEYDEELDPVTYEVLRHRLWTVNEEHGRTLENVSGSPVAYFGQDFNTTVHAADGEVILGAAYVQLFSPIAELIIKWVLENRSANPGIRDGDVFLCNDPWIGTTHQPDVFFVAPVFHDGELYCWLSNALHQYDIGGVEAGGFCPSAEDVYMEPTPIPPIKVIEEGTVRQDLRQMYMRHSRLPKLMGLDFNAQVAGLNVTRKKINDLIDQYGPRVLKGAMEKIVRDSEATFLSKLESVPDGTWRARSYMDGSRIGDHGLYKGEIQLKKEGDRLKFTNEGTAANKDSMNITYSGFRTAISCAINPMLLYDQLWVISGAYRHIDIDIEPGTMNCAEYPSGVSCGGNMSIELSISLLYDVVNRMISSSDESRDDIISDPLCGMISISQSGIDQWGNPFGTMNLDVMGTGFGARADRDGIDVGGIIYSPKGPLPNVENNEQDYPMLYLYRREAQNSGGPGEFRGGTGMEACWIPHGTDAIETVENGSGGIQPNTRGLAAYPGAPIRCRSVDNSGVEQTMKEGQIPGDIEEIAEELVQYPPKSKFVQEPDEVVETRSGGTAGLGDPLHRDPEKVLQDVVKGLVTREAAHDYYGVVLAEENGFLTVDEPATEDQRDEILERRLAESSVPAEGETT